MSNDKFIEYENIPLITYLDSIGLSKEDALRLGILLYHGIRFDAIDRLESIFQTGSILCGNKINSSFISYNGFKRYLYISPDDYENCNMGKYISVMPYEDGIEFNTFVRKNIFFAIKSTIDAYKTIHLSYDDYCELRSSKKGFKNLYSYAFNEYLVKDEISLDDILYIGIHSKYYSDNYDENVNEVIKLMNIYKIKIPFIDVRTHDVLFEYNKDENKKMVKTK